MLMLISLSAALAQASAAPAPPPTSTSVSKPSEGADKLICKRYAEVGSNIARQKRCLTRAQWDQTARDAQGIRRSMEQSWTTPNL